MNDRSRIQADPIPVLGLAAVTATVTVFAVAQGLSYPLLSFILERQGVQPGLIGLSAAMAPLGMLLAAPLVPAIVNRTGGVRLVLICAAACASLFALIGWTQNVYLWFPLRFLVGVAVIPLYILSETWMIELALARMRGRILGIYSSVIAMGFASGPLSLSLVGTQGWPPFLLGIAAFCLCGLFVLAVSARLPQFQEDEQQGTIRRFLPHAPTLLLAVLVAAGFETAVMALLPSYGRHFAIPEATMAILLTVFIIGNVALQVPFGLLADLWGALGYGIYTMAIIELGQRFRGSMLVAGNAAFAVMWGVGGVTAPSSAGGMMQAVGPHGLPIVLGAMCLTVAIFAMLRVLRRAH